MMRQSENFDRLPEPKRVRRSIDEKLASFFREHRDELSDLQSSMLDEHRKLIDEQNACINNDAALEMERMSLDETEDRLRISEIESIQNLLADKISDLNEKIDATELKLTEISSKFQTLKAEVAPSAKNIANN